MNLNSKYIFFPGSFVINEKKRNWGIGQIQSCIENKVTINFENVGKKVININEIYLKVIDNLKK